MALAALAVPAATIGTAQASTPHRTLHPGDRGSDVTSLQRTLKALHYDPGTVNGRYTRDTIPAVWAFQKVNHLRPSSTVGPATWRALAHPRTPRPLIAAGPADRAEVDLGRQLLYVYRNSGLSLISHISTGSGASYVERGMRAQAITPTGDFRVYRYAKGWQHSSLGYLYNPLYFTGGFAIHGEPSVPLHPASHGCVRIPMHTSTLTPGLIPVGTAVYIRN
jgi:peptidoglycan hydrolase-like protein with peptidoglycan-binding domain